MSVYCCERRGDALSQRLEEVLRLCSDSHIGVGNCNQKAIRFCSEIGNVFPNDMKSLMQCCRWEARSSGSGGEMLPWGWRHRRVLNAPSQPCSRERPGVYPGLLGISPGIIYLTLHTQGLARLRRC